MTLPVSSEFPQVPFVQYAPHMPPAVPQVLRASQIAYLAPAVASAIANEAALKAHAHEARMFTYNVLSSNFWQNQFFAEAVNLCLEYIALECSKGKYRMPESAIADSVTHVLTLYTGDMLFKFPALQEKVASNVVDAAMSNAGVFNCLKTEINSMYTGHPGNFQGHMQLQPQQQGWPQHQMTPNMPQGGQVVMTPQGPMWVPHQPMPVHQPVMHHSPFPAAQVPMQHTRFGNPSPGSADRFASGNDRSFDVRQDRFIAKTSNFPAHQEVQQQTQHVQPTQTAPVTPKKEMPVLEIYQGNEMDRAKHQINFFGSNYSLDSIARQQQHSQQSTELAKQKMDETHNVNVHPEYFLEMSLDTAIITAKSKQYAIQNGETGRKIFRCFPMITLPFVCNQDIGDYVKQLYDAETFAELASRFKSIGAALEIKKQTSGLSETYAESVVIFLASIDNYMTDLVNEFVQTGLESTPWIHSFSEDIVELTGVIKRKCGEAGLHAFRKFETEIMETIFGEQLDEDLRKETIDNYAIDEKLSTAVFSVNHSLTLTFMTSKELGFNFGPYGIRSVAVVDPATAPSLYSLLQSLKEHREQLNVKTVIDYLVTSDNVRYRIFSSYINPGRYMIRKVNANG